MNIIKKNGNLCISIIC